MTHSLETILEALQATFPALSLDTRAMLTDETVISVPGDVLTEVVGELIESFDFYHLSTITGLDTGEGLVLLYHFWNIHGLTLYVALPYTEARVPTLTELIPGVAMYEREIHEMLGVDFTGLETSAPFLLPDDWDDTLPLRKQAVESEDEV
ncbi:MAG TPA: NADH-quinone oxidoreductase subunit C [Chloroflexi bacterium]|nr:NADH-quinone oxidoreductase subunit C [Chloroflexota bacterium]